MTSQNSQRGKPEREIPSDAPARPLGQYLRTLRNAVGKPPYRKLEEYSGYSHNRLSTTANGYCVDLNKVENYVETVREYARRNGINLDQQLQSYAEQNGLPPGFDIMDRAREIHAALPPDVQRRLASRKAKREAKKAVAAAEEESGNDEARTDRSIPRQRRVRVDDGPPVPESLAHASTFADLVASLNDMIAGQGWDVSMRAWEIHRNHIPPYLLSEEALDVLTGRRPLTLLIYVKVLLAAEAGYVERDGEGAVLRAYHPDWITAWNRVKSRSLAGTPNNRSQSSGDGRTTESPVPPSLKSKLINLLLRLLRHERPRPVPPVDEPSIGLPAPTSLTTDPPSTSVDNKEAT
jgi:hypothetical protein